jgi:anthranilate phosphoribosyltransferase
MTPTELAAILDTLRAKGVASAEVPLAAGPLRVLFAPEAPPPGDDVTPGGWKGPAKLDAEWDPTADRSLP